MSVYVVKPVETWPGEETPASKRKRSPFKLNYHRLHEGLVRELKHLRGGEVVLRLYLRDGHIRNDGQMRADARPSSPGAILEFMSNLKGMRMRFAADTFGFWQDNLDAILRTLEALRMIDRYGVTSGQQYEGFKALPAKGGTTVTREAATVTIDRYNIGYADRSWEAKIRVARAASHPDRHDGNSDEWHNVQAAEKVLRDAGVI